MKEKNSILSFSREVKLEIIENKPMRKHFKDALAYGLFLYCSNFSVKEISLRTGQKEVAETFQWIAQNILGKEVDVKISQISTGEGVYRVWVVEKPQRERLIAYFNDRQENFLKDEQETYAFLAGAFLSCGNVTDPEKSYHLEFVTPDEESGENLIALFNQTLTKLHTTTRRNRFVVYCKECSQIQDALTMMGASKASLRMVEVEMLKNVRNHANRVTNCDTANIDKTVIASTQQIDDIQLVLEAEGKAGLSDFMLDTARVRMENPYASLRELAELFEPPISRSGLHHRLASFATMAKKMREKGRGNV